MNHDSYKSKTRVLGGLISPNINARKPVFNSPGQRDELATIRWRKVFKLRSVISTIQM
jgi:hypothetical protein